MYILYINIIYISYTLYKKILVPETKTDSFSEGSRVLQEPHQVQGCGWGSGWVWTSDSLLACCCLSHRRRMRSLLQCWLSWRLNARQSSRISSLLPVGSYSRSSTFCLTGSWDHWDYQHCQWAAKPNHWHQWLQQAGFHCTHSQCHSDQQLSVRGSWVSCLPGDLPGAQEQRSVAVMSPRNYEVFRLALYIHTYI